VTAAVWLMAFAVGNRTAYTEKDSEPAACADGIGAHDGRDRARRARTFRPIDSPEPPGPARGIRGALFPGGVETSLKISPRFEHGEIANSRCRKTPRPI